MIAIVAVAIAATALPALAAGATPEAIRACVERNLVRYTAPGSAVVAQYTDLETACIAALDGPGVSVQFTGDPVDGQTDSAGAGGGGTSGGGGDAPAGTPSGGTPSPDGAGAPGSPGSPGTAAPAVPSAEPVAGSADLVRRAGGSEASAQSPLPGSLSGAPGWLIGLLAGVGLVVAGAIAIGVQRRAR